MARPASASPAADATIREVRLADRLNRRAVACFKATHRLSTLDDEAHLAVLRQIQAQPTCTQREIANSLGYSLGKTNYCLRALIRQGAVKVRNFRNSSNKLAYAYTLTPAGLHAKMEATRRFLDRKQREFEQLQREIETLRAEMAGQSDGSCERS